MGDLSKLDLKTSYHKGQDNIADDFYLPCMERSQEYDRAVGYFRSSIYTLAWPSLKEFVREGGKIRIICSPVLASEDRAAIEEGYSARSESEVGEQLESEIKDMLNNPVLSKPTRVLASLVAMGVIDFKLAFGGKESDPRHKRLFHDKVGIFRDSAEKDDSNSVVFKGSMNETWSGLSADGNLESVDVFVSWGDKRDTDRVDSEISYFEDLWNDVYPDAKVQDFPDVAQEALVSASEVDEWPELVDEINDEIERARSNSPDQGPDPRIPFPHQQNAIDAWEDQGRRGILKHATGSGKTFTALCAIRKSLQEGEIPVVFVPGKELLAQWKEELRSTNQDLEPKLLVCGGGNNEWRKEGLLRSWTRPKGDARIVLTTVQTATTPDFKKLLQDGEHLFFVGDEVHRMGSEKNREILSFDSGPRLGLSATPERFSDPEGTNALFNYFNGIVDPPYTLSDAIDDGRLTPYFYHVHKVKLKPHEQDQWEEETRKISQLYAQAHSGDNPDEELLERINNYQIQRARIIKKAYNKTERAIEVISQNYKPGQRWLVYCEGKDQLNQVLNSLRDAGLNALEYHSKMEGDREQTLNYFEDNGGIVVSIKCLDEGVDIPNATHALILASSKNPREFIQRRGRVLRKSDNKHIAKVHDMVVMPNQMDTESPVTSIIESELGRAIKFGEDAQNPKAVADLKSIALEAGIDYKVVADEGFEHD
jgi:superfamily II DNA or RNA helicase